MATPFLWMVSTSLNPPANQYTKYLIPDPFTFNNFRVLLGVQIDFPLLFYNSFLISIMVTIGQLLTCLMAAFVFAAVQFASATCSSSCCSLR